MDKQDLQPVASKKIFTTGIATKQRLICSFKFFFSPSTSSSDFQVACRTANFVDYITSPPTSCEEYINTRLPKFVAFEPSKNAKEVANKLRIQSGGENSLEKFQPWWSVHKIRHHYQRQGSPCWNSWTWPQMLWNALWKSRPTSSAMSTTDDTCRDKWKRSWKADEARATVRERYLRQIWETMFRIWFAKLLRNLNFRIVTPTQVKLRVIERLDLFLWLMKVNSIFNAPRPWTQRIDLRIFQKNRRHILDIRSLHIKKNPVYAPVRHLAPIRKTISLCQ